MRHMQQDDLSVRLEPTVPGEDVSIALALVNTRLHGPDGPRDLLAVPADVRAWLAGHGLVPKVGPEGDRRSDGGRGDGRVGDDGRGSDRRSSTARGSDEWGSTGWDSAGWGDRLRELRESIRALLAARIDDAVPDVADLTAVNAALAAAPCVTSVAWDDGGPRVGQRRTPRTDDPLAPALAALAADAGELLAGPHAAQLARCSAHRCIRMFIRTHAARQVCSTRCGDRVRAARHYAKRREQAAS